jgi:diaminopropionate ammonia-lyase
MAKKYLNFKFSEFTTNKNFNFSRKKILKVLPEKHLLDAHKVISKWKGYKKTPLINLRILSKNLRTNNIFYKDESKRFGLKSFKALGGAYAVEKIVKGKKKVTISTATAGNHGKSVSWGTKKIGARCKIFISENVSDTRALEMEKLGADVIKVKGNYEN